MHSETSTLGGQTKIRNTYSNNFLNNQNYIISQKNIYYRLSKILGYIDKYEENFWAKEKLIIFSIYLFSPGIIIFSGYYRFLDILIILFLIYLTLTIYFLLRWKVNKIRLDDRRFSHYSLILDPPNSNKYYLFNKGFYKISNDFAENNYYKIIKK